MNGHNAAQISTCTPCPVGSMHYKKAIISHTQKINTVHVLETFLSACLLFSQCVVDYDAMPFSNTWGHYCTSGESRFIQRSEVVLIWLYFLFFPPCDPTLLLSKAIFQNINNAEPCREGNTIQVFVLGCFLYSVPG